MKQEEYTAYVELSGAYAATGCGIADGWRSRSCRSKPPIAAEDRSTISHQLVRSSPHQHESSRINPFREKNSSSQSAKKPHKD